MDPRGDDLSQLGSGASGDARFDASQYAFFGNDIVEEVELGGLEEDEEENVASAGDEEFQFSSLDERAEGESLGSLSEIDDLAGAFSKVLGLTCSASGYERNWNVFENVHLKKRNPLAQQKLNDLVFVKYNKASRVRYEDRDYLNLISLQEIDDSNEWLLRRMEEDEKNAGDDLVFGDDDDLTCGMVELALGINEQGTSRRTWACATTKKNAPKQAKGKVKAPIVIEEEEEYVDSDDEEEEEEEEKRKRRLKKLLVTMMTMMKITN